MKIRIFAAGAVAFASTLTLSVPASAGHTSDPTIGHYEWQLAPHTGTKEIALGGRYVWVGPRAMASATPPACDPAMQRSTATQARDCMEPMRGDAASPAPGNG